MVLACDIGNTTITWGLFDGQTLTAHWRISSRPQKTQNEYRVVIVDLLHAAGIALDQITGSIVCSVVPALTADLHPLLESLSHHRPLLVNHTLDFGLRLDHYPRPDEIGPDRLVNAAAAYARYRTSVIVVDCGTATTFDVVGHAGEFLGGAIAPGLGIAAEALILRTAKLPTVELRRPKSAIGQDTVTSMQAGLLIGYAGLIDGLVTRMQQELPHPAMVIATGGLTPIVAPECRTIEEVCPHLTLEGLELLYRRENS